MKKITQKEIIMRFFKQNPNRDIPHPKVVDWATSEYQKITNEIFRDPDRQIRPLYDQGQLIKVSKGVYRYDPELIQNKTLSKFSKEQKLAILKRDGSKCVVCGKGEADGIELHIDHIKPKNKGGEATIENGQTLCAEHNFKKKHYKQTETGKKMFIRLYGASKAINDKQTMDFCQQILEVFEKNDINGHIVWNK